MTTHRLAFADPAPPPELPARLAFSNGVDIVVPTVHRLVFGAPAVTGLPVHLAFGDGDVEPTPEPTDVTVSLVARITRLSGSITTQYISDTARPTVGSIASHWQDAQPLHQAFASAWQDARPLHIARLAKWQHALPTGRSLRARWSDATRLARQVQVQFERAVSVGTWPLRGAFEQAVPRGDAVATTYTEALRVGTWPVSSLFQQAFRDRRAYVGVRCQEGTGLVVGFIETGSDALPFQAMVATRYQEARRPPIGQWVRPVVPPAPDPCYLPGLPVRLVFSQESGTGLPLVFICERHSPPPEPGGTVVVPVRRVYMTINNVSLLRVDGAEPIDAYAFGMSIDVDSWTWSWSATLHADALPLIQPEVGGDPVDILATINGVHYRLAAESYSRQRQFGNTRISVKGRGRAAILDAPYAPVLNHGNTAARTAQQLMADVLTVNGVGIGWDVDWGLTDWLVPGNVWTHQGAYMSAILDIANAAGGYVQPHDTAPTLRVLPRYPAAPWDWAGLTGGFELPSDAVAVEGIDWQRKAAYDRVFVEGVKTGAGVRGQVTRVGTTGGVLAPMVVHPLITHVDAARQRGIAELSNTGSQAHVSLRLPVLAETGVIKPGALVRYVDGATTHLGLVRSTQVEWQRPVLRQVLTVETHPA